MIVNAVESIRNAGIVVEIAASDGEKIRKIIILTHRERDTYS